MAGRNDFAIADALQALAQAIGNPNRGETVGRIKVIDKKDNLIME